MLIANTSLPISTLSSVLSKLTEVTVIESLKLTAPAKSPPALGTAIFSIAFLTLKGVKARLSLESPAIASSKVTVGAIHSRLLDSLKSSLVVTFGLFRINRLLVGSDSNQSELKNFVQTPLLILKS